MYQSPIEIIFKDMETKIENAIIQAVQNVDIRVDKEELIRALQYDRDQYEKGRRDALNELVRCKDCVYAKIPNLLYPDLWCNFHYRNVDFSDFCNHGKLKGADHENH